MLQTGQYQQEAITSWNSLLNYEKKLPKTKEGKPKRWLFRGQEKSDQFDLTTSLERAATDFGENHSRMPELEKRLLREFKRHLHHYTSDVPQDNLEWLALMQHYGAPTRLLDWTQTFYVAAFFAVENANKKGGEIWALDVDWFKPETVIPQIASGLFTETRTRYAEDKDADLPYMEQMAMIDYLLDSPRPLVVPVNPFRLNARLMIQQGVFLFPGDISKSFEENLCTPDYAPAAKESLVRFFLPSDIDFRKEILINLHQMNIDRATLFPGLGGFAESLRTRIGFLPEIIEAF